MDGLDDFRTFYELADHIVTDASKEDIAEAARSGRTTDRRFCRVSPDEAKADRPRGRPPGPTRPGRA
jgi:hypothetical protein